MDPQNPATPPVVTPPAPEPVTPGAQAQEPAKKPEGEAPKAKAEPNIQLSPKDLTERLQRATSSQLKKLFGTDDVNEILAIKKEHDELKAKSEEARRLQLTENEKLKEDLAKAQKEAEAFRKKYDGERRSTVIAKEQTKIQSIFNEHLQPDVFKYVARDLAEDLITVRKLTPKQITALTEKDLRKWLSSYLKNKPLFAKVGSVSPDAKNKQPATNGGQPTPAPVPAPATAAKTATDKTPRPGKPNSMSDKEYREYKKANGLNYLPG